MQRALRLWYKNIHLYNHYCSLGINCTSFQGWVVSRNCQTHSDVTFPLINTLRILHLLKRQKMQTFFQLAKTNVPWYGNFFGSSNKQSCPQTVSTTEQKWKQENMSQCWGESSAKARRGAISHKFSLLAVCEYLHFGKQPFPRSLPVPQHKQSMVLSASTLFKWFVLERGPGPRTEDL